jgi:hypothetical protein
MLQHIEKNVAHENCAEWIVDFQEIVRVSSAPAPDPVPVPEEGEAVSPATEVKEKVVPKKKPAS